MPEEESQAVQIARLQERQKAEERLREAHDGFHDFRLGLIGRTLMGLILAALGALAVHILERGG